MIDTFGLSDVNVVTIQALSGTGYPGVSSPDILDNIIPFIGGVEEKLEVNQKKTLAHFLKKELNLLILKFLHKLYV